MKNVIVTGATSMIGAALIERLSKASEIKTIYAIIRPSKEGDEYYNKRARVKLDNKVSLIECDICDYYKLIDLVSEKCDTFYHLAWPRTATYDETIDDMLKKADAAKYVLDAVKMASKLGCTKFIGAGSQSEYGLTKDGVYKEDMSCIPVRADGVYHLAAGQIAKMASEKVNMKCIWMRIFSVYGANDRNNSMISTTIDRLINKEHCSFTKSEQMWDYVHADDVAEAFYLVGDKVYTHKTYNVAYGISRPLHEYIEIIANILDANSFLGIGELQYPSNAIMNMIVDVSELKKDTGWEPKVDFNTGIQKIVNERIG